MSAPARYRPSGCSGQTAAAPLSGSPLPLPLLLPLPRHSFPVPWRKRASSGRSGPAPECRSSSRRHPLPGSGSSSPLSVPRGCKSCSSRRCIRSWPWQWRLSHSPSIAWPSSRCPWRGWHWWHSLPRWPHWPLRYWHCPLHWKHLPLHWRPRRPRWLWNSGRSSRWHLHWRKLGPSTLSSGRNSV